jgi:hypothetical protein
MFLGAQIFWEEMLTGAHGHRPSVAVTSVPFSSGMGKVSGRGARVTRDSFFPVILSRNEHGEAR